MICANCGNPKLLDLFCCEGGASMGYYRAGFCVTGVDIRFHHQRYPFEFIRGDALEVFDDIHREFSAFAASPPCQGHSITNWLTKKHVPDYIGEVRDRFKRTGKPWVIENVEDAYKELIDPILLCGTMFPGLNTYRHRYFESNVKLTAPEHPKHTYKNVKMGRTLKEGDWYHAVGDFSSVAYVRKNMQVPWMTREGISQCIPPVYGELVGRALRNGTTDEEEAVGRYGRLAKYRV